MNAVARGNEGGVVTGSVFLRRAADAVE